MVGNIVLALFIFYYVIPAAFWLLCWFMLAVYKRPKTVLAVIVMAVCLVAVYSR